MFFCGSTISIVSLFCGIEIPKVLQLPVDSYACTKTLPPLIEKDTLKASLVILVTLAISPVL